MRRLYVISKKDFAYKKHPKGMKKILFAVVALLLPLAAVADGYTNLWKQVRDAQKKDLPKTEIKVLGQIAAKAAAEKQYGQLLKAQLMRAAAQTAISPDSTDAEIARVEQSEAKTANRVLKAVYASVLGRLYSDGSRKQGDEAWKKSRQWYAASMADMPLLAQHKSAEYTPALVNGEDSRIFYDDLLHVIGFEAGEYEALRAYYEQNGNRPAACVCAAKKLAQTRPDYIAKAKKSKYLQQVDSLIRVYSDLREAGELAVMHYNVIANAEDETAEEKVNYINYALSRWGAWPRTNILRNALADLQQPSFAINVGDYMLLPNVERPLRINGLRNIDELYVKVYRVKANGNASIDPTTAKGYARMKHLVETEPVFTATKRYIGQPAWKELSDTLGIRPLPVGVYLIEATTNNAGIQPQRELLRVSNLYIMHQALPDKKLRIAVVNATTGHPVSGAHVVLTKESTKGNTSVTLTTDRNGEAEYAYGNSNRPDKIYAYTDDDKACGVFDVSTSYYYWSDGWQSNDRVEAFTDRAIYRPGQIVYVSAVAWHADKPTLSSHAMGGTQLTFALIDANDRQIAEKTVATDSYGAAACNFTLPQSGLTGYFRVSVKSPHSGATASFRVEQYKRPTFQVTFDKYKDAYREGDTISVRGVATTYSGVPVQGARVAYTVNRRQGLWWFRYGQAITEMDNDSTVTADDGSFTVRVPMLMPDDVRRGDRLFFNFDVNAMVTDGAGETREGSTSLPLGNRPAVLAVDLPDKIMRDSLRTITFTCKNLSGEEIASQVSYRIDNGEWKTTTTQTATPVTTKLTSGLHHLEAICEGDTLRKDAILFSMSDKHPATVTNDWFYLSAKQFPADGKPVYVQAGSSADDTQVYYTVFSGKKMLARGTRHISNEVGTRKLQYKEAYGDGLTLTFAWVVRGKLYQHTAQITRPQPDTHLKLVWKTFRDKLKPGQKEQWTLTVAAPSGKPAQAQVLATMYDKSLDALTAPNNWSLYNDFSFSLPHNRWAGGSNDAIGLYGFQPYTSFKERALSFTHFDSDMFGWYSPFVMGGGLRIGGYGNVTRARRMRLMAKAQDGVSEPQAMAVKESVSTFNLAEVAVNVGDSGSSSPTGKDTGRVSLRENLNETAFFYPALTTDADGNVNISFTLPESVTTWRFMALAHDSLMNNAVITAEAVASKPVMVQPNVPRFLREGDNATVSTRIFNTTAQRQSGTVRLVIADPETDRVIMEKRQTFALLPNGSVASTFKVDAAQLAAKANGQTLLVARVYAEGNGFSDGEQHYLPLLPDKEQVVNTIPFYQNEAGTKDIDLTQLFPADSKDRRLTVEYTNNPAWLVVQALPTVANPSAKDAMSLATALYANIIGRSILTASPKIEQTVKLWQQETGNATSLTSNLEKDEELKTIVLNETPWVAEAASETDQKRQLASFFDSSVMDYRISDFAKQLAQLQNADGSFAWWPGMAGSRYMTTAIVETLTRLNTMAGRQSLTTDMLDKAFGYLDSEAKKEVIELKKEEKKGAKNLQPSETACHYLYASALAGRDRTADMLYLVSLLDKASASLSIYGKAGAAIILAQYGNLKHAQEYLQSIREYTVYKDETGRYFDTPKAQYSWFDYRIPTQTFAIEALMRLTPADTVTVAEMRRWLLHEKRTTGWSTPINCVNAVYAFLGGRRQEAGDSKQQAAVTINAQLLASQGESAVIKLDGEPLDLPKATAGIGYVKVAKDVSNANSLSVVKTSNGTSWGAVYGQFLQKATNVVDAAAGLKVKREIVSTNGDSVQSYKVGGKVKVRITVIADRDYDFVQLQDKRAACLEPVSQVSGYRRGCYVAPQDNVTNYYFDRLAKGTHVVETEYYVDRAGDYASGICTVQCAYAPEFGGRAAGLRLSVTQ